MGGVRKSAIERPAPIVHDTHEALADARYRANNVTTALRAIAEMLLEAAATEDSGEVSKAWALIQTLANEQDAICIDIEAVEDALAREVAE